MAPPAAILFRAAVAGDLAAIEALINDAYRGPEASFKLTERLIADDVQHYFRDGHFLVAAVAGNEHKIAAVVFYKVANDEISFGPLAVSPDLQRTGLGKALVEQVERIGREQHCHRITCTVVDVRTDNIEYYLHHGFHKTGKVIDFPHPDRVKFPVVFFELAKPL